MTIILKIKRLPTEEWKGDRRWQASPYEFEDREHAERVLEWLQTTKLKDIPHEAKIIECDG